ncbi:MAG: transglutaminase-like domain-containing protein [Opitutaceae bacterium]
MEQRTLNKEAREAIANLLDDPSPAVRRGLLNHFQELAEVGRDFLREIANGPNRIAALHARWYLMELKFADPVSEFRGFIRSLGYELETGAFLLSRTVYPELDISEFCGRLDQIAARCRELMAEPLLVRERCKIINRVLFHELGFRGNIEDYADPENSFVHRVLERRKGLPITLSILYLLIADRCGLQLEPVGVPGHFLVGCYHEGDVFFIDSFDHGRFLSAEDVIAYLEQRKIPVEESYLAPTTVREVLCRCCRNLASHFAAAKQPPLARLFASFVEEFETAYEQNTSS